MRGVVTPWRVNDAVAYDLALSAADASLLHTDAGPGERDRVLSVDGFDRTAVAKLPRERPRQATRKDAADTAIDEEALLARVIIPTLFAGARPTAEPRFVLVAGQPGSGTTRAIGSLLGDAPQGAAVITAEVLSAFHPESGVPTNDARERVADTTATWLTGCLRYAREERLSVVLVGPFPETDAVAGVVRHFAGEGFRAEVAVVAVPPVESMLTLASLYASRLQAGDRDAVLEDWESSDEDFLHTKLTLQALEQDAVVDRIMIRDRSGTVTFDSQQDDSRTTAAAAFAMAAATPMTTLQSVQWLSELKRVTRFTQTTRSVPPALTALLVELHGRAIREVIPRLAVPAGSTVTRALESRHAQQLVQLRESIAERRAEFAGPSVAAASPDGPSVSR